MQKRKRKYYILVMFIVGMVFLVGCKPGIEQEKANKENVNTEEVTKEEDLHKVTGDEKKKKTQIENKNAVVITNDEKELKVGKEDKDSKETEKIQEKDISDKNEKKQNIENKTEYSGTIESLKEPRTYYAALNLNVRKGPETSYDVVGYLQTGQAAEVIGIAENGWYQIVFDNKKYYASNKYLLESKEEIEVLQKEKREEAIRIEENTSLTQPVKNTVNSAGIIMIGDSRCVQMQEAVQGGGCSWICENSKGYAWLEEVAIGWADPSVGKGTKVVFCLGVNDPGNVRKYAELVNAKAAEWRERGATVYYVSVNPVWENPYTTKEQVENFNAAMPGLLSGVIWVDTYTWLMENGCKIVDGLHYDAATSINIFNLIMGSI